MKDYIPQQSARGYFAHEVFVQMRTNKNIWVVSGDLGYKMWDPVRKEYPERYINVGAAEQSMIGVAVGLALEGMIPIVYTITTFLLLRPFETIRNYLDYEGIPVKLVGAGRDKDYIDDGISHWCPEDKEIMKIFKNIEARWPESKEESPDLVKEMLSSNKPWYINLRR